MRWLSMFAQVIAAGWLVGELLQVPERERPRGVLAYLIFFALVTMLGFWQLRGAGLGDAYKTLYIAFTAASLLLMGFITWAAAGAIPTPLLVWFALSALAFGSASAALASWFGNRTPGNAALVGLSVLFFAAGQVTGWSALAHPFAAQRSLLTGLGVLWTATAGWHLALCVGLTRAEKDWRGLNEWLPATVGFVILAALAFTIHGQVELSRVPAAQMDVAIAQELENADAAASFDSWRVQ